MFISPVWWARVVLRPASVVLALVSLATPLPAQAQSNPVVIENQQPGSSAWQLGDLYGRPVASDSPGQIKGYASATSVNKGQAITFYVTVNPAQTYTIDVYRIGWYQGLGGRLMQHIGPLNGVQQPTCPTNASTGLIECNWSVGYTMTTQTSWTSGIYLAVLRNAQGFYSYMVFALRDDNRVANLLFQQSVTTYQANNNYPDNNTTGKSTFENNSFGANTIAGTPRAVKVSFDRPYNAEGAGNFLFAEINLVRWLEREGYDVTYSTNIDTHANGQRLLNYKGFISPPHDEFWSKTMYDAAFAARDAGVNLGFFGANSIYWQVRFEPSSTGVPNRVMVAYKDQLIDPVADPNLETVMWRDDPLNRPEQVLMGVQYTNGPQDGWDNYVVTNSNHWVYAGTGFANGNTVPGIVGPETDRFVSGYPGPNAVPGTFTLLSHSPYSGSGGGPDYSNSSIYQAQSGAWVFASGTMVWSWGLDDFYPEGNVETVDVRIQRATRNILNRFITSNLPPTAAASATPLQGLAPLSVAFSSAGSSDPEGQSLSYLWQFGDGTTSTASNPTHVYSANGQYSVTLTVSDGNSTTAATPLTIAVGPVMPAPLAFAQSNGGFNDASGTTLTVQLTNVKAGSLIVAYAKWEGTAASTVSLSDGTSTFVADTLNSAGNNDLHGRFFYLLSATASGTVNYTATWSAGRPYRRLLIYEYSYGGTVSFDGSNRATATSGSLTAGTITTTGSDEIVFGAYGEYNTNNTTNERINNVVADRVFRTGVASMWSKSFTAPFTGTATATGNSSTWLGNVIAFKRTVTTGPNTAPTISALGPQTVPEDTGTGALAVTVGDAETAAGSLTLTGATTNSTLVPVANIVFGGTGANRTVTVTPAPNQSGTATITVTVSDSQATASTSFLLTVTAVNDLPTISALANQTTSAGTAVGPLALTVGDAETAAGSLTLTGATTNATLVAVANIVFGGTGANRTVTVTPAPSQTGTATITVTVSDSQATASTSFLLTVTGSNTAPTISALGPQTLPEDTGTGALAVTVGDAETAAGSLTLTGATTNSTLVPVANIVFGGTGANRTVTVTPAPNQSGTATITVTVSDSQATASTSFLLTVTAVNDLPTISALANQTTSAGTAVGPLALTVGDAETAAGSLTLTGATTNATLVPVANIVFGGTGANRTVTVTPAPSQTGTATITVTVSDSQATASTSFLLTVTAVGDLPLAFAQSKGGSNNASGTTLTVQLTNVKAGSLIVAYVKWEGTAASTVTLSDGTGAFVADTQNSAGNNDLHGRFFYRLSSTASGTVNYTATWSTGSPYRRLLLYEYSYGGTLSFDASNRATATSGTLTAGTITTTGSDEIVFGAYGEYNTNNTTNERINNVVADRVLRTSVTSMWSKGFNAPFTGTATATGNSTTWIGNVIAFRRN